MSTAVSDIRSQPVVIMVGTRLDTMGGISTVVNGYMAAGLFDRAFIRYVPSHRDGSALQKLVIAVRGFATFIRILATRKVRLVHIHLSSRASFWRKLPFAIVTSFARRPLLLHLHGSEFMTFYRDECGPVRKRLVQLVFDRADTIIALSPQWADAIREITSNPHVEVILNRVPVNEARANRVTNNLEPQILFLGRLGRRKGIYDLLDALVNVKGRGTRFKLTAAGDGEIAEVAARAQQLGLANRIEIPGWIDETAKNTLLSRADVFVLPSHAEGLPMSLLEAMASELPVVCSSVGGIPVAVTDGVEGAIVPPGDVDALAEVLDRLLTSPVLRTELGQNAFKRAKAEFDVRLSVEQVLAIYARYSTS